MNKADLYKAYKALEQSHMKIEMELNDMKENMLQFSHDFDSDEKNKYYKKIGEENEKLKKTLVRWQEKADFNLSDSDDEEDAAQAAALAAFDNDSDDEEVSFCGVNGHRCEECTDCARSKVCDTCKCVGGCYEDCLSNC